MLFLFMRLFSSSLFFITLFLFFSPFTLHAQETPIVITEIGAYELTDHEWIEIFNRSSGSINLEGWKFVEGFTESKPDGIKHSLSVHHGSFLLAPSAYAIIAQKADIFLADHASTTVTILDSSWGTLKESGERVQLLDAEGVAQEDFIYLATPDTSLERIDSNIFDYTSANWTPHSTSNSAGRANSASDNDTNQNDNTADDGTTDNNDSSNTANDTTATTTPEITNQDIAPENTAPSSGSSGSSPTISFGNVLVNEFVSDPDDEDVEWIELYNTTDQTISFEGWVIEDGTEAQTMISGTINSKGFFVIEKPKGKLNNTGDIIFLYTQQHTLIDRVTYGGWDDGNKNDNAPKAQDPYSTARKIDGLNSFNNASDFSLTTTPTKGTSNIVTQENNENSTDILSLPNTTYSSYPNTIVINELYPNPPGTDDAEFIELLNIGNIAVNVQGWIIGDTTTKRYTLTQEDLGTTTLSPLDILVLPRSITKIALNNTGGETVKLFHPDKVLSDSTSYTEKAEEGTSYARNSEGQWQWTLTTTEGKSNTITIPNQSPVPFFEIAYQGNAANPLYEPGEVLAFDASDSTDPDNDQLVFAWDFGDATSANSIAPLHIFEKEGIYTVALTISDSSITTATSSTIIISTTTNTSTPSRILEPVSTSPYTPTNHTIFINELYPNPPGDDTQGEFIELINIGATPFDLSLWTLDDDEEGSRPYTIPEYTIIDPNNFLTFPRSQTKLALNNTHDAVRLFASNEQLVDSIYFDKIAEGASYIKLGNEWRWTEQPTPGELNVLVEPSTLAKKSSEPARHIALEDIRQHEIGEHITTTGIIAVAPRTFGKTTLYIVGSPGIQLYMHSGEWPELSVGEIVEVTGTLSTVQGEHRLKLTSADVITRMGTQEIVSPLTLAAADIAKEYEGYLVTIEGEVVQKRGNSFYLDDGTEEVRAYIKDSTGIDAKAYKKGDYLAITGLVSQTRAGFRILPRNADDIEKKEGVVAGASEESEYATDASIPKPKNFWWNGVKKYTGTALFVLGFFGILIALFYPHKNKSE